MYETFMVPVDLNKLPEEIDREHKKSLERGYILADAVHYSYEKIDGSSILSEFWKFAYVNKGSIMMICTVYVTPFSDGSAKYKVERCEFTEESILQDIRACKEKLKTIHGVA